MTIQFNGLKVDYSSVDIKFNGLPISTINKISFTDSGSGYSANSVPISKTKGEYRVSMAFEISDEDWRKFQNMLSVRGPRRGWLVRNRLYRTLYGAREASRYWRAPVEPM